ncbi:hypothetical protein KUTeg_000020 [Tegillarca granosa]|uniref:BTB domain-containing protein n=1 Tax=Tegillarca granosa TaxID=220873 RepID=A0ABQ9FYW3_TEGGR|nr:hypothetical protein KUTeg_000020 [Tegillarca granosa]
MIGSRDFWSQEKKKDPSVMLFKDRQGLTEDLKYVISVPELCDVTFLVGQDRLPVYGVRAVLATRSRMFYQMILAKQGEMKSNVQKKSLIQRTARKIYKFLSNNDSIQRQSDFIPKVTIVIEDFDARMMNAAQVFEFPELGEACWDFALNCLKPETLIPLLTSAKKYSHFRGTGLLMQKVFEKIHRSPELVRACQHMCMEDLLSIDEYVMEP